MEKLQREHRERWLKRYASDDLDVQALALFKAYRNVAHHLVLSRRQPRLGVDYASIAKERFGDCCLYLFSCCWAAGLDAVPELAPPKLVVHELEDAMALMAMTFSNVLMAARGSWVGRSALPAAVDSALAAVKLAADLCCVDLEEAVGSVLCKV